MTRSIRLLLGAGALAIGVLVAVRVRQGRVITGHLDVSPLLAQLASNREPPAASEAVKQACAGSDVCSCAEVAARAALDADLHELATRTLDAAPRACPRASTLLGERAEALARAGAQPARAAAEAVLAKDVTDQYAELALARVEYDAMHMKLCSDHANKALSFGRGAEAERLLGRSALTRELYQEAETHFQNLAKAEPGDLEAAFSAAVCNDKLGRYREAREGFLQTLQIDPKHVTARSYLVVLTHNAGADAEARHHLQKLEQLVPKDEPNLQALEQLVGGRGAGALQSPSTVSSVNGRVMIQGKH